MATHHVLSHLEGLDRAPGIPNIVQILAPAQVEPPTGQADPLHGRKQHIGEPTRAIQAYANSNHIAATCWMFPSRTPATASPDAEDLRRDFGPVPNKGCPLGTSPNGIHTITSGASSGCMILKQLDNLGWNEANKNGSRPHPLLTEPSHGGNHSHPFSVCPVYQVVLRPQTSTVAGPCLRGRPYHQFGLQHHLADIEFLLLHPPFNRP